MLLLVELLQDSLGVRVPAVFGYYSTRMILASLTSLLLSIFVGPRFIKKLYELKIGQSIRMEECPMLGQLHEKKKNTPTMGGVLILAVMVVSLLLWMDLTHVFTLILLCTTVSLGFLGGYDDYLKLKYRNAKGLSARGKMAAQVALATVLALYLFWPPLSEAIHFGRWFAPPEVVESKGSPLTLQEYASRLYVPFLKDPLLKGGGLAALLLGVLTILVVTGSSNAVNLTDGLDGLAAGCLVMVASCLAVFSFVSNHREIASYLHIVYVEGSGEIAIYLSAFGGACLGFLWYNAHPAQVFMGDTGSLALGGVLGVSAVLLKRELLLALVGGVFVAEAVSVILQVGSFHLRHKKRIFLCAPLHHHFEYKGWAETKVVIRFWIISLLLCIVGIASLKFQ